jgi:hypothetical protein
MTLSLFSSSRYIARIGQNILNTRYLAILFSIDARSIKILLFYLAK